MARLLTCVMVLWLCVGATSGDEPNKATKEELKQLAGEWKIVAAEADGKPVDSRGSVTFTIDGKCTISSGRSGLPDLETTFSIDPTKEPKHMDVVGATSKTTHKGIYEVKGDKLRAVFQPDANGERPTEFATKKKGEVMFTYERVKPK